MNESFAENYKFQVKFLLDSGTPLAGFQHKPDENTNSF